MNTHQYNTTGNATIGGVQVTRGRDPNNTHPIVTAFMQDMAGRFKRLRGLIRRTVGYANDAFNLSQSANAELSPVELFMNADEREVFDFPTNSGKTEAFIRQLRAWIQDELLTISDPVRVQAGEHWTAEYLQDAYVQGVQNAQGRLMQEGVSLQPDIPAEILNTTTSVRTLQQIYTRAFEQLRGVTDDMARELRSTLTRGFAEGWNPRKMADKLTNDVRDLQRTRAMTIAQTETIDAAASGTLDEYEKSGVDGVSHASFMTAKDQHVCAYCRAIEEFTYTISEMRSTAVQFRGQVYRLKPAAHPRGRCSVRPKIGIGELGPLEDRIPEEATLVTT